VAGRENDQEGANSHPKLKEKSRKAYRMYLIGIPLESHLFSNLVIAKENTLRQSDGLLLIALCQKLYLVGATSTGGVADDFSRYRF